METEYLSLEALGAVLDLPQKYLRRLAKEKRIPSLIVGKRMRFQEQAVRAALSELEQAVPDSRQALSLKVRSFALLSFVEEGAVSG